MCVSRVRIELTFHDATVNLCSGMGIHLRLLHNGVILCRTHCVCTINTFIHFVHGNQSQVAHVVAVVQGGTLGQTYSSAPTVGYHKLNGAERLDRARTKY